MGFFFKSTVIALLAIVTVTACDKDGNGDENLVLTGGTQQVQTVYADQTQKSGSINFTAKAAWTATVGAVTTKAPIHQPDWLELSAYSGGAGDFSLTMTLQPNLTGSDRKAEIRIVCGDTVITIVVEQKGTKEDGTVPGADTAKKRITRIRQDNYYYGTSVEYDGTETYDFYYDGGDRVVKIVQTEVDEISGEPGAGSVTTVTTVTITYGDQSVSYEISSSENGVESNDKPTGSIVLDENGRAVSGRYMDYEYKDEVYQYTAVYTLSYDTAGRLVRSVSHDEDGGDPSEVRLTWADDGNPTQAWWGTNITGEHIVDKARYGTVANKTNLDLNWLLVLDTEGFDFATGDPGKIFACMGYTGTRSKNMATSVSESEYSGGSDTFKYVYETDTEGFPLSVGRTVTNNYHPEPWQDRKYVITYGE